MGKRRRPETSDERAALVPADKRPARSRDDDDDDEEKKQPVTRTKAVEVDDPSMTTNTVVIDKIDGALYRYMWEATHRESQEPVLGVCDELSSTLVFNKMYGQSVAMNVAESKNPYAVPTPVADSRRRESYHLFSAFHPHRRTTRLQPEDFGFAITYGGLNPDGTMRPLLMCERTRQLIERATNFGWRALMYIGDGSRSDFPTGIVALEGWPFNIVKKPYTHKETGRVYDLDDYVECTDMVEYKTRVERILEHAATLAQQIPVSMDVVDGTPTLNPPSAIEVDPLEPVEMAAPRVEEID
jgi:hypothetical protein